MPVSSYAVIPAGVVANRAGVSVYFDLSCTIVWCRVVGWHITSSPCRLLRSPSCRVAPQELERPINIHRWRQLEGSNPRMYELICKVQGLQKRLIGAHEELVQMDARIREKERVYLELKTVLARQPGPEVRPYPMADSAFRFALRVVAVVTSGGGGGGGGGRAGDVCRWRSSCWCTSRT